MFRLDKPGPKTRSRLVRQVLALLRSNQFSFDQLLQGSNALLKQSDLIILFLHHLVQTLDSRESHPLGIASVDVPIRSRAVEHRRQIVQRLRVESLGRGIGCAGGGQLQSAANIRLSIDVEFGDWDRSGSHRETDAHIRSVVPTPLFNSVAVCDSRVTSY